MTLDEIEHFRQLGSRTAGHPEYGHAQGIETTTGPLGQGLANAVGMAIAEESLAARFGRKIVDHHTWVIAGDGCLMEGISHEAIGLAGKQALSRLIVMWDDNGISIDGKVSLADVTDQKARFAASGWSVHECDGHDPDDIDRALTEAKASDLPVDDRLPDAHRLRRADQAGHQGGARIAARARGDRQGPRDLRLAVAAVRGAGEDPRRVARDRRARGSDTDGVGGAAAASCRRASAPSSSG